MLDDALLDDGPRLIEADRGGALRAVATAGAQVRATWSAAEESGLDTLTGLRPRALVLLARPGPGQAAMRMVAALLTPTCPAPVVVTTVAPPWLGPLDVVVASHRGRDGDAGEAGVAEAVDRAVRHGAHVVLSGPPEGPVAAAAAGRALAVVTRLPAPEGADTATDVAAAFATASALDLLSVDREALADRLDDEAERDGPRGEAFVNPAKTLALRLAEHTPLLWGTDATAGALSEYGVAVLAARAGVVGQATTLAGAAALPALHARLSESSVPDSIFADPFDDPVERDVPAPRLVVVSVSEDLATRRAAEDATARWPVADRLEIDDVDLGGEGTDRDALRACVLAARLDFAALYLGLATGAHAAAVGAG